MECRVFFIAKCPLSPRLVVIARVSSMNQIGVFENYLSYIGILSNYVCVCVLRIVI